MKNFPPIDEPALLTRLRRPSLPVDVVLDTDAYNEIDDQYALAYLVKNEASLRIKAITAAPFSNHKADTPAIGMEKSCNEIRNVLTLMGRRDLLPLVLRGSERYLPDEDTPVLSDAAARIAEAAMRYAPDKPLYIVAIGAITNVASALLLRPEMRDNVVIVWLGGHAPHWPANDEFNLKQDVAAARVVLGSGAAVVLLPCMGVVSGFAATGAEIDRFLRGKNALCDYLAQVTAAEAASWGAREVWSRVLWDVTAVAWLLGRGFVLDAWAHSPVATYDNRWAMDPTRHPIKCAYHIERDALLGDLFAKLADTRAAGSDLP